MASRVTDDDGASMAPVLRWIAWLVVAALWLFVVASLLGFDAADPPGFAAWPPNEPAANWMGGIGALVAYWSYYTLGLGAWAFLAGLVVLICLHFGGARVDHPLVRIVGVLVVAVAAAGVQALLMPGTARLPDLPGGVVGFVGSAELREHFNVAGTLLWMLVAATIGVIVAYDRWLVPAGAGLLRQAGWLGRTAGGGASSIRGVLPAIGAWFVDLAERLKPVKRVPVRANDLDDDERMKPKVEKRKKAEARAKRIEKDIPTDAGEDEDEEDLEEEYDEDYDEVDPDEEDYEEELDETDDEEEDQELVAEDDQLEEDDDEVGAPQVFNEDRLREKISKMPVLFASQNRSVAKEEDLRDLQGVSIEGYRFPSLELLEEPEEDFNDKLDEMVREGAEALERALHEYRIKGEVVGIESGPVITLYDVRLAPGTKVNQLNVVASDIARALKAVNVRIVANQVGRDTVGIEVPNPTKEKVRLKELMGRPEKFQGMKLPMFLGKDASGEPLIADLTKMPHVLIAGTTGSGKSVCMNTIIMSFLYTKKPNELRLVLVDPKMVEMSQFKDIPHLMCPVVTEMHKAAAILEWAVTKMDERYELLAEAGCRDISSYNDLDWEEIKERLGYETDEQAARVPRKLPYMVFIIDELADLMMTNKEVEGAIVRIAQKARAVGIHLILATQRPQANVVTGLIKGNMPCRITFKVASGLDSRIILDQKGGELLLGQGDMLFLSPSNHKLMRSQGTLVDDIEIRRVVKFVREVSGPTYERQIMQLGQPEGALTDDDRLLQSANNNSASLRRALKDPLFDRAVDIVLESKRGSVSLLQRRLAIGYTRASRLIDLMGIAGVISDHKGSVARDVKITAEEWAAMKEIAAKDAARDPDDNDLAGFEDEPFEEEASVEVEVVGNVDDMHEDDLREDDGPEQDEQDEDVEEGSDDESEEDADEEDEDEEDEDEFDDDETDEEGEEDEEYDEDEDGEDEDADDEEDADEEYEDDEEVDEQEYDEEDEAEEDEAEEDEEEGVDEEDEDEDEAEDEEPPFEPDPPKVETRPANASKRAAGKRRR
ncbi:MAG: DNA translocase FtsK 4TM domain-containing protein [Phycisphaerales bacterium]